MNKGRGFKVYEGAVSIEISMSVALEFCGRSAFCNQARFLKTDFLSYAEWLRYEGRNDVTADSYLDFIQGISVFYNFTTIEDYLKGCLDETVISNANSGNYIYGNDCELVEVDKLMDILYISMFTLHDTSSSQSFFKSNVFRIRWYTLPSRYPRKIGFVLQRLG